MCAEGDFFGGAEDAVVVGVEFAHHALAPFGVDELFDLEGFHFFGRDLAVGIGVVFFHPLFSEFGGHGHSFGFAEDAVTVGVKLGHAIHDLGPRGSLVGGLLDDIALLLGGLVWDRDCFGGLKSGCGLGAHECRAGVGGGRRALWSGRRFWRGVGEVDNGAEGGCAQCECGYEDGFGVHGDPLAAELAAVLD